VIEGGVVHREPEVTGEALYRSVQSADREIQEATQGRTKRCEVADESVVVTKSRPEKAGNSLEEKTGTTCGLFAGGVGSQKP
jgi:hypothetical protein